jgi:hypothetical protein
MRRRLVAAAAFSTLAWLVPGLVITADAAPGSTVANGRRCAVDPISNSGGNLVGWVQAGPLAAAATAASIQITCTIQVGGANSTHNGTGNDADFVTSRIETQVVSIPPTDNGQPPIVSYFVPPDTPVFLCTEAIINGTSWYWDATVVAEGPVDQLDTATGWTTSSGAFCDQVRSQPIPGGGCTTTYANALLVGPVPDPLNTTPNQWIAYLSAGAFHLVDNGGPATVDFLICLL